MPSFSGAVAEYILSHRKVCIAGRAVAIVDGNFEVSASQVGISRISNPKVLTASPGNLQGTQKDLENRGRGETHGCIEPGGGCRGRDYIFGKEAQNVQSRKSSGAKHHKGRDVSISLAGVYIRPNHVSWTGTGTTTSHSQVFREMLVGD